MSLKADSISWLAPAGRALDLLARSLPAEPKLVLTVFGSAPLQLLLDPSFLSGDVDLFPTEEAYDFLVNFVAAHEMDKKEAGFYIQVCDPRAFRSTTDWRDRAVEVERHGHTFRFPHPWDILVSKLQRLEEKDLKAFELVIARTGHPTEEEFVKHLQKAVDLYRPKFDEEAGLGDMLNNTRLLWHTLWRKEIDVRARIIRPALERVRHDYDAGDPTLKTRLAHLRVSRESSSS
ncbi:MAG: hypothetical protein HYY24_01030 [Verrucomicrobia bacterium]|nr:hypothetical protein [Verrucomicrobiota bacterium]